MNELTTHTAARFENTSKSATQNGLSDLAASFKLLADETRLRVLSLLIQSGELNVRTLCSYLDQSQPAVSHHLALLRDAGVIEARRDGKHNYYSCIAGRLESLIDGNWRGVMEQAECEPRVPSSLNGSPSVQNTNGHGGRSVDRHDTIGGPSQVGNSVGTSTGNHDYLRTSAPQATNDAGQAVRTRAGAAPIAEPG